MTSTDPQALAEALAAQLRDRDRAVAPVAFPQSAEAGAQHPGLYAWWSDPEGQELLAASLGEPIPALIYAGQAGATSVRIGTVRVATLLSRIKSNHLRGNIGSSTFRRTLAAALRPTLGLRVARPGKLDRAGEQQLSEWIREHLAVGIVPYPDRATLAAVEHAVLAILNPPLNLDGMPATPTRTRLTLLRRQLAVIDEAGPTERR